MIGFGGRAASGSTTARSASVRSTSVRLALVAAVTAAIAVAFVGIGGVAAADPGSALACAGDGDGAIFETDSGFRVAYNASAPMPDGGEIFPDGETVAVRNVTLSSARASSVALDDATNETACLSAVEATAAPVTVDRDDGRAVVLDGEVEAIALSADDDGDALVTLSANATGAFELTIEEAGAEGDGLELLDANGDALDKTTVDENRSATFTVPEGARTLTVQSASGGGRGGGIGGGGGGGVRVPSPPPSTPASFALSAFDVSPTTVVEGEAVTATVTVTNDGDESGTYAVALTIDGESAATETVDLDGGESGSVSFEHAFAEAGEYEVAVGGEAPTTVTVEPAAPTDEAGADDADGPEDDGRSLGVVVAIAAAVSLLGIAIGARRWLDGRR